MEGPRPPNEGQALTGIMQELDSIILEAKLNLPPQPHNMPLLRLALCVEQLAFVAKSLENQTADLLEQAKRPSHD